jgi:tyrosine-protein phosphatase SIW14
MGFRIQPGNLKRKLLQSMCKTVRLVCTSGLRLLLTLSLGLSAGMPASAKGDRPSPATAAAGLENIHVGNFGRISDNYYRGAQPATADYNDLARLGIKTVIDLAREGRIDEQEIVERAGMQFYRIPMTTSDRPSQAAITEFLNLVNDPANQPVFVHCQGGRHRTGVMTAVFRMTQQGWTAEQAYAEMKKYRFEGFPGHPVLKQFVYDYYGELDHSLAQNER